MQTLQLTQIVIHATMILVTGKFERHSFKGICIRDEHRALKCAVGAIKRN